MNDNKYINGFRFKIKGKHEKCGIGKIYNTELTLKNETELYNITGTIKYTYCEKEDVTNVEFWEDDK